MEYRRQGPQVKESTGIISQTYNLSTQETCLEFKASLCYKVSF